MLLLAAVAQAAPLHPCGLIREDPSTIPWMIEDTIVPEAPRRLSGSVDLSDEMPPVGDQGQQGSCTAWAIGYYMKTHYEYLEHEWDLSDSTHQFSPKFIYNQINGGVDQGSGTSEAFALIADQGCATWADCPYHQDSFVSWPSESAYARAIPYRGGSSHYFWMRDESGINAAKTRLDSGYTTAIAIQVYSNFDNIADFDYTYCVADTYGGIRGGHLVTIVGYDDTMTTNDGTGAFKLVNSWGTGWGLSGYWWMSYVAARSSALSQQVGFYIDDLTDYSPTMLGRVKITHAARDKIGIRLGVGRTSSPYWYKNFRTWRYPRTDRAFPNHNIVFDMTEGASYITGGQTDSVFVRAIDDSSDSKSGTVNYFSATHLAWGRTGVSTETPVSIPDYNTAVHARAKIPRPRDVGVTVILAPTGTIDSGTVVTPRARVRNYGVDAATFPVTFRIGSSYTDTKTVTSLAANDSVLVSFTNWTARPRGPLATRCSTALTNDDNHANDTLPGSVTVRVTNVGVTAILAPTGTVDSGAVVTPRARVSNYGTGAATFPVTFRIGSSYTDTKTITSLAAGDSTLVSFTNWTARPRGPLATRCSTALSGDQVRTNDTLAGTVTVRVTNVGVTAILAPPDTVDSGTVVTPRARVKNYGNATVSFPVSFRIGSFYSNSQTVSSLAPGDSALVSFTSWTAEQTGTHVKRCSTALSGDQVRGNDTLSGTVTVRSVAVLDVGVTAIVAPTGTVDSGTVVTPRARVKNYGTGAATFPVTFRIGSSYTDTKTVTGLAANDSVLVSFTNWTALPRGPLATRCSTALTDDQYHTNDTLPGSVTVRVTDVGVTALVAPPAAVDSGAAITPRARVKNSGTAAASFPVFFRIGTFYSDSQSVSSLAAGDSVLVSFANWTAVERGSHATRCSTALTNDQYRANDTLAGSVTVRVTNVGVTAIVAPSDTVDSGTAVTPQARVRNYGTAAASFPVRFRVGSLYSDSQNVASLAPGDSALVSFTAWIPVQRGTFVKRCTTALAGDVIPANDTLSGSAMVRVKDVGVAGISRPAGSYGQGEPVTPSATIRNNGNVAIACEVWMLLTGPNDSLYYSDSVNVANLDTARSLVVSTFRPCTLQLLGDWTARCSITLAGDLRLDNNVMTRGFKIRTPWVEREPVPDPPSYEPVKDGAWLAYDAGSGLVYAGKGNNSSDFYSYSNAANAWTQRCSIPPGLEAKPPRHGACGVGDGAGHIYMVKGNNTLGFWRYDVAADSWRQLADVPVGSSRRVKAGSGLVYAEIGDSGFVYLLKGPTCEFYRFNVTTGTWETMALAPVGERSKWYDGSFLTFDGDRTIYAHKAKYHELWAYDIVTAAWGSTQLTGMPYVGRDACSRQLRGGGSGVWCEGALYALKGGSTGEFWRYDANADTWTEFNQLPPLGSSGNRKVSTGGCMVNVEGTLFAFKGNQTNEFWRYSLVSREALRIPREGVMAGRAASGVRGVAIRPNPLASGFAVVRCNLPKGGSATLELFDASGRRVHQSFVIRHSESRLDLRSMPAGVYIVKVTTEGFSTTQKLVVEH